MNINIVKLHELVDQWYQEQLKANEGEPAGEVSFEQPEEVKEKRELPKDKRAVRTKAQGDKVYVTDEVKKTRQWVTSPEVLASLGFTLEDVVEVEDGELLRYQMLPPAYKPVTDAAA